MSENKKEYSASEIALEQKDLSPEARAMIIENKYALPHNVDALKVSLYYDLLDKYHEVCKNRNQLRDLLNEVEFSQNKSLHFVSWISSNGYSNIDSDFKVSKNYWTKDGVKYLHREQLWSLFLNELELKKKK